MHLLVRGCIFLYHVVEKREAVMPMAWVRWNENPKEKRVGDCTVRAISKLLEMDWEWTYVALCLQGLMMCDMPSANAVWGEFLRNMGYRRGLAEQACGECMTVEAFCEAYPTGKYLLALSGHVVTVIDGDYYDSWDSGQELPIYYWTKERKER